jgi:transcriptional regulator of arginine metabolism
MSNRNQQIGMTKQDRQLKIKNLIAHKTLATQSDVLDELKVAGIDITQATLSRDFAELGIVRMHTADSYRLAIPATHEKESIRSLIGVEILSITHNEVMIVIKTLVGRAHGVGSFLDGLQTPDILGTIAGDDTLLIIPKSVKDIQKIITFIQNKISETN